MEKDRLFVNLRTWPFVDFQENGKRYEVRACGRQGFTEENVYNGRRVELRKAWDRGSSWGQLVKF